MIFIVTAMEAVPGVRRIIGENGKGILSGFVE